MEDLKDNDLISGADALRALADGVNPEEIEGKFSSGIETYFLSMDGKVDVFLKYLNEKLFRLKPQTIKLELEFPKPFEPKEGEEYFGLNNDDFFGYSKYIKGRFSVSLLAFRTENDAKKAVEQLRKIKGAV